jgi:hypothetical protein
VRTIRYVLTSDGMSRNIRECTESIERAVMESKRRGCTQVVLYGRATLRSSLNTRAASTV